MDEHLQHRCNQLLKEDTEIFNILEVNILKYGLQVFQTNPLFIKYVKILEERHLYDHKNIHLYLKYLDEIYLMRNSFLDHMNNQNIIAVCLDNMKQTDIEIQLLKEQMETLGI